MQKVHVLLHPTLIDTHAAWADCRFVGRSDGNTSRASSISIWAICWTRARSKRIGSEPMLWVPKTTSTQGDFSTMAPRSFCARQPPTAICISGFCRFKGAKWDRLP